MAVEEKNDVENKKKVEELKKRFVNDMEPSLYADTFMFYRFLKSKNFNVDEAETMLRKHLEWRKEFKIDTILNEKIIPEELEEYCPLSIIGYDKEHAPIKYFPYGSTDLKGIQMSVKFIDRMRYVIKTLEEEMVLIEKQNKKYNVNLEGTVFIIDMKNFSFAKATDKKCIEDMIYITRMFQNNYPERLKNVFIINANSFFQIAFAMIKTFLEAAILDKIQIFIAEEEWKAVLLEKIDADVLPAFLGGNKTDPDGDPLCKSFVKHGGTIPQKYHTCKSQNSLSKCKDAKKLVIPRAAFSEIELVVKEPGSHIEWEFETKTRDIGFGLFLNEKDADGEEKITELVPLLRLDTEDFSETGLYKCEKSGTYVILFDNSYSWVRSKEIYYRASVITPKQHEKELATS